MGLAENANLLTNVCVLEVERHLMTNEKLILTLGLIVLLTGTGWASSNFAFSDSTDFYADSAAVPTPGEVAFTAADSLIPQPSLWSVEPLTGLHFRHTTLQERQANSWGSATYLVENPGLNPTMNGGATASAIIPISPVTALKVDLVYSLSHLAKSFTAIYESQSIGNIPPATTNSVDLHYYSLAPVPTTIVTSAEVIGENDGGFAGSVRVGAISAAVGSFNNWWYIAPLPTLDGVPVVIAALSLVTLSPDQGTGIVNPADWIPAPQGATPMQAVAVTNYNYAITGEVKWCTQNSSNWKALMDKTQSEITASYTNTATQSPNPTNVKLVASSAYCTLTKGSMTAANACANTGGCSDARGFNYPFNGDSDVATSYIRHAWDSVTLARNYVVIAPLKAMQVLHYSTFSDGASGRLCGMADAIGGGNFPAPNNGAVVAGAEGVSVAMGSYYPSGTGCQNFTSSHEMGHSLNGIHDDGVYDGCHDIMGRSSATNANCRWNIFAPSSKTRINQCPTHTNTGGVADCPRVGTK